MRRNWWPLMPGVGVRRAVVAIAGFELRALVVTVLASAVILAAFPVSAPAVHAAVPKVVIIVGPVGSRTDAYRADGNEAAKAARAAGATVEKIYSPDATWPRVRDALQGASLVVYLGHGNGWPSKYRSSPWPKTQNGLGLNPEAGAGDSAHQYFGEKYLARDVRLAPNAVVLLVHLCYASGNSEPGLPEGDLATGQQRVDNYAAGWLAAGAGAVLAEGLGGPGYYVGRILAGDGTIETIWRRAPTAHGHVLAFPSERTPGMTGLMDPTHKSSGFYRSLVGRIEMRADEVARGATRVTARDSTGRTQSGLPAGPSVTDATLKGIPTAGSSLRITLTFDKSDRKAARGLGIGVRWSPLTLDAPPIARDLVSATAPPASSSDPSTGADVATPSTAPTDPSSDPATGPDTAAIPIEETGRPPDAPPITLISPEVPGALVTVSDVQAKGSRVSADVAVPSEPGLYRLAVTIHDGDGVAFDAGTQEGIPAFTVRVMGELSTVVSAASRVSAVAGAAIDLPVSVANTGHIAWVADQPVRPAAGAPSRPERGDLYAVVVGQWMQLDGPNVALDALAARATIKPPPGGSEDVVLSFAAPPEAGTYLLVLDVVSPLYGSLMALGGSPVVVRVDVISPEAAGGPDSSRQVDPETRRPRT